VFVDRVAACTVQPEEHSRPKPATSLPKGIRRRLQASGTLGEHRISRDDGTATESRQSNRDTTMTRRADGELETDVLRALWMLDRPASASDVIDEMATDLAYTSIATVLGRLCDKGLVTRQRAGRAYHYVAISTEADLTAQRLRTVLDAAADRRSALVGFAQALEPDDIAHLAAILDQTR